MYELRLIVFSVLIRLQLAAPAHHGYVYQKDVSEYCRRRAVPSVFLGRHVAESNAEMLYFTKLDLPYNCFVSIRTETSSNIIMVIQLTSGPDLVESCQRSGNQLTVYEFGETFGGYWGPIPEAVVKMSRYATTPRQYTLQTRPATTTTEESDVEGTEEETSKAPETTTWRPTENAEFITYNVPLMNLSGNLVPGVWHADKSFDYEENFDTLYDVTPRNDEPYFSTVMPLVQFSVNEQVNALDSPVGARYELDYNLGAFTPDSRLTMMLPSSTRSRNYRNRNLWKLKKGPKAIKPKNEPLFSKYTDTIQTPKNYALPDDMHGLAARRGNVNEESYKLIEDLMKTLNKSSDFLDNESRLRQSYMPILKNISDTHFNSSAYLVPWPMYLPAKKINISKTNRNSEPRNGTTSSPVISPNSFQADETDNLKSTSVKSSSAETAKNTQSFTKSTRITNGTKEGQYIHVQAADAVSIKKTNNTTTGNPSSDTKAKGKKETEIVKPVSRGRKSTVAVSPEKFTQPPSGSLVDHESWENVVQVAPAIAGLLSQDPRNTAPQRAAHTEDAATHMRKRRTIAPIPIAPARPHAHRTSYARSPAARTQRVADTEHFAQLVELPDDEMSSRVALRFMRQYAGEKLFSICQQYETEHKLRHIVLFNSSRIILALHNYTISRMTVVVTTATTPRGSDHRCPDATIECQVGGTRVCIDETSACDGIPNCGATDIYDEDRLECGAAMGLLHNVYLAAFTSLGLLLTGLYIVHYWLRRCVPKVADAFFIYTDGTENVLYLNTIMRSPTDINMRTKNYGEGLFEDNMHSTSYNEEKQKGFCKRLSSMFFRIIKIRRKRGPIVSVERENNTKSDMHRMYSFAEMEIQNISRNLNLKVDEEVQTGESLEMAFLKMINSKKLEAPLKNPDRNSGLWRFRLPFESPRNKDRNKSITTEQSIHSAGPSAVASWNFGQRAATGEDEKELENTFYDPQFFPLDADLKGSFSAQSRKRLRFDKKTRLISAADIEEVNDASTSRLRGGVALPRTSRPPPRNIHNLDVKSLAKEPTASEIRNFFKGKIKKKKKDRK